MARLVVLTHSAASATALQACCASWLDAMFVPPIEVCTVPPDAWPQNGGLTAYERLAAAIEPPRDARSGDVLVVVDAIQPLEMSAVSEHVTWDHLVAMLVLTFPDVRWAFAACLGATAIGDGNMRLEFPRDDHSLDAVVTRSHRDTLFDPTGLREWVRRCTNDRLRELVAGEGQAPFETPVRRECAAVIDEEHDYAYLHGYTAYRYGFRTEVITTWGLMAERFGDRDGRKTHGYQLVLEDMRLGFPDKPANVHLSKLGSATGPPDPNTRDFHCPLLDASRDTSEWRFMITTGQAAEQRLVDDNKAELQTRKRERGGCEFKPLGGICELWQKLGLTKGLPGQGRPGNAAGFFWPPIAALERDYSGHGSPGKLAHIASRLVRRATAIADSATAAIDYVHASVLACDAAELLAGKTPTLTVSVVALKHECEARAECTFLGAGFRVSLQGRLKELEGEVDSIARWFHPSGSERVKRDVTANIVNRLALVFRDVGRMEEEHACLVELRRLNRKLSRPASFWRVDRWLVHGVLAYGEWLLQSFGHLAAVTALWVLVFAGLVHLLQPAPGSPTQTIGHVVGAFFGASPYTENPAAVRVLSWFAVAIGLFHLGTLISFIYSLISRR